MDLEPRGRRLLALAALALLTACADGAADRPPVDSFRPARPEGGVEVGADEDLQGRIDAAPAGAVLYLAAGVHRGPITLTKSLTIWGPREAVVRSAGHGTTVSVEAGGVKLLGFTVDGSGTRFDLLDAAVRVRADDAELQGLRVEGALFGILCEKSRRLLLRGNRIVGSGQPALGLRGDGVRLWETTDSLLEHNHVSDSRDMVVWYSSRNRFVGNTVTGSRYGTHFMYSNGNEVVDGRFVDNVVGIFIMYSHDITIEHCLLARSSGAAGFGLGVKESGNLKVSANRFLQNSTGTYLDTSPLDLDEHNLFEKNLYRLNGIAVVFHSSAHRNTFRGNSFRDNLEQVRVEGGGDALDVLWQQNDYDDYQGYDLDGDDIGDVPYELRRLSSDLISRYPDLAFFRGSPALGLVDVASHVMPLFEPKSILVDEQPRMTPLEPEVRDAR